MVEEVRFSGMFRNVDKAFKNMNAAELHGVSRIGRSGARLDWTVHGGQGFLEGFQLTPDANLSFGSFVAPREDAGVSQADERLFMLRACLSADLSYATDSIGQVSFAHPAVVVAVIPKGLPMRTIMGTGRNQMAGLDCRGTGFADLLGLSERQLPPLIRQGLSGAGQGGVLASFPLDAAVAALVADLISCPMLGETRRLYATGKIFELIGWMLHRAEDLPHPRPLKMRVRSRDLELVKQAGEILGRRYAQPPTIAQIADEVGLNQTKLKYLFRESYGASISGYCQERRMQEAQRLLLQGDLNISQIAERIGYQHQSSFTLAFREHCGVAPKDYRKQRAPTALYLEH